MSKRIKLYRGISDFVPSTITFSDLETECESNNLEFEPSDDGAFQDKLDGSLDYERLVAQVVSSLELREKLVFMFQLLRDGGFRLDHGTCAKTIGVSRKTYMDTLSTVRVKVGLIMMGGSTHTQTTGNQ